MSTKTILTSIPDRSMDASGRYDLLDLRRRKGDSHDAHKALFGSGVASASADRYPSQVPPQEPYFE